MNIIVQAGGRGSRLRHHTWNKPKCLVSVNGRPILYQLFDRFPDDTFYIIGDYAFDKLEAYLKNNTPDVTYKLIHTNQKGTASGIQQALYEINNGEPVLLVWSDLIIGELPKLPDNSTSVVYVTNAFTCRWSYTDNQLQEKPSNTAGIPGLFYFKNKKFLSNIPSSGEFMRWFSENVLNYTTIQANDLQELGDFSTIEANNDAQFCRFFNHVKISDDKVIKTTIDHNYAHLINGEINWYKEVKKLGFSRIPELYELNPLTMQRIQGKHLWEITDLSKREQRSVLADYLDSLRNLHSRGETVSDQKQVREVYISKTQQRVNGVKTLIPNFNRPEITINGRKCRNIFHSKYQHLWNQITQLTYAEKFTPIHGDPTFSNTLVDHNLKIWFIDPRGYFAGPGIWGDPDYDFAKVYYSAIGGYDAFNRRKFKLYIDDETVEILQPDSSIKSVAQQLFREFFPNSVQKIKVLHGLIWLSLSGYVLDDIDSIIGSFYNGLYWIEDALND